MIKGGIFLIEWTSSTLIETAKELKKRGAPIAYWTLNWVHRSTKAVNQKDFPGTIFHHTLEAVKGLPAARFVASNFEPIGQELIEKLYHCQNQVLSMMDRMDYTGVSLQKRKQLYHQYLKYWQAVLKKLEPRAIVFDTAPHMVYDFVLYHLAKVLGIKTIILEITSIPDRLVIQETIEKGSEALALELAQERADVKLEELPKDLQEYYQKMTALDQNYLFYQAPYVSREKKTAFLPYRPKPKSILRKLKPSKLTILTKTIKKYFKRLKKTFSRSSHLTTFDRNFKGLKLYFQVRK